MIFFEKFTQVPLQLQILNLLNILFGHILSDDAGVELMIAVESEHLDIFVVREKAPEYFFFGKPMIEKMYFVQKFVFFFEMLESCHHRCATLDFDLT